MDADTAQLLDLTSLGDKAAAAELTSRVYEELRALARRYFARGGTGDAVTLQPTILVHEAYLRLVDQSRTDFKSQTHFFAVAALAMRHVLIDYARGRKRAKRGGGWQRITLTGIAAGARSDEVELSALNEALDELAKLDARAAKVVELRFFGGLTEKGVAVALDVSERTVRNDWSMARAWLRSTLRDGDETKQP